MLKKKRVMMVVVGDGGGWMEVWEKSVGFSKQELFVPIQLTHVPWNLPVYLTLIFEESDL